MMMLAAMTDIVVAVVANAPVTVAGIARLRLSACTHTYCRERWKIVLDVSFFELRRGPILTLT